jgi:hypothetical protein
MYVSLYVKRCRCVYVCLSKNVVGVLRACVVCVCIQENMHEDTVYRHEACSYYICAYACICTHSCIFYTHTHILSIYIHITYIHTYIQCYTVHKPLLRCVNTDTC